MMGVQVVCGTYMNRVVPIRVRCTQKGADKGGGLLCILNGVKDIMITKLSG